MVEDLLNYYKKAENILNYIDWKSFIKKYFLIMILNILSLLAFIMNKNGWIFIVFICFYLFVIHILNKEIKTALFNKFTIKSNKYFWDKVSFDIALVEDIEDYLDGKNKDNNQKLKIMIDTKNKEKMQHLIEMVEELRDGLRTPNLINWGFIVAVFTPIWIKYIDWFFVKHINTGLQIFYFSLAVVIVLFIIGLPSVVFYDEFFYSRYRVSKRLVNILKEITLKNV